MSWFLRRSRKRFSCRGGRFALIDAQRALFRPRAERSSGGAHCPALPNRVKKRYTGFARGTLLDLPQLQPWFQGHEFRLSISKTTRRSQVTQSRLAILTCWLDPTTVASQLYWAPCVFWRRAFGRRAPATPSS